MSALSVLTRAAERELLRSKQFVAGFVVIAVFLVSILQFLGLRLWLLPLLAGPVPDPDAILAAASSIVYATALVLNGLSLNIGSGQPLIRAKASGSFESILATPATARELWLARSLASALPGIAVGLAGGALSAAALSVACLRPAGVSFLSSPWPLVNCFLLLPAVFMLLAFLVHLVGLPGNPVSGNAIAQIFLPAYTSLVINLAVRDMIGPSHANLAVIQTAIVLVLAGVIAGALRGLSKERIVLSSRR